MIIDRSIWWFCVVLATVVVAAVNGQRCAEGQQTRRNNMYYVCRNGVDVPVACATVEGIRIEPGAVHRTATHVFTCQQPHPQIYALVPTACIRNGRELGIGSTVDDQNFWFTCTREGDTIVLKISGCIGARGERIGPNGIVVKQNFLFRCAFTGASVRMEPYGCVVDGSHHPAGQDIIKRDFWYQCNVLPTGDGLELKVGGCLDHTGRKLYPGQTAVRDRFVFRCEVIGDQVRFHSVGCADENGGQHMIGETWRHGTGPIGYVMECKKDGNSISITTRQCYYQGFDGQGPLDPQCVRRFGRTLVKCVRSPDNRIYGEMTTNASEQQYQSALNAGFRPC